LSPKKPERHAHENVPLDKEVQTPPFWHGPDWQALVWQVLPKKPVGHEQLNVLFEREVHAPLFEHGFGIQRFV